MITALIITVTVAIIFIALFSVTSEQFGYFQF